ncbi:MAG: ribosome maturation factor RimP [Acidiphilium sp.]
MNQTRPNHTGLEGRIAELIAPGLESIGYELVRVAIMGRQTPTVQIMADRADQSQLSLDDCERISHLVSAVLDVEDPISSAWTLEISSAGIDRPLTRVKDWNRFAGHLARIELDVPTAAGRKRVTGTVLGADEKTARMKLDSGETVELPHSDIRRAKLVMTEDLIKAAETPPTAN